MKKTVERLLRGITPEEAREMIPLLTRIAEGEQVPELKAPSKCPWCGSSYVVKKGHDLDGKQRWMCCLCRRTFNATTRGNLADEAASIR